MSTLARLCALLACLILLPVATASAAATGSLSGTVIDDLGRPLPGVLVSPNRTTPSPTDTLAGTGLVESDAQGRWRYDALPPGTYSTTFTKDGYDPRYGWNASDDVVVEAGGTTTQDVFLVERSSVITGRVVDRQGAPVVGAAVGGYTAELGVTDADGRFRGRVVPGDHVLGITADGYRPVFDLGRSDPRALRVSVDRGATADTGDLLLRRAPDVACFTESGEWWDRDPAAGFAPRSPASPFLLPRSEHLCPDVDASELPAEPPAREVRVGTPAPPAVAASAPVPVPAARPAAVRAVPVVAATLRAARALRVTGDTFAVRSVCASSCGGRIVATTRSSKAAVATATVRTGGGTRTHRLRLTSAGKRLLARAREGLTVDLRWDAPGTAKDRAGPRTRIARRG